MLLCSENFLLKFHNYGTSKMSQLIQMQVKRHMIYRIKHIINFCDSIGMTYVLLTDNLKKYDLIYIYVRLSRRIKLLEFYYYHNDNNNDRILKI